MKKRLVLIALCALSLVPTGAFADSDRIRKEISDRVKAEQDFGSHDIDIDVRRGLVTITGNVSSEVSRARLTEIAEVVAGVDEVKNLVTVQGRWPSTNAVGVNTSPISASAVNSLADKITSRARQELTKENFSLHVSQSGNELLLKGQVDTTEGAQRIRRIAEEEAPQRVIRNQLVVTEEVVTDDQIRSRVLTALNKEPLIKTDDLQISVKDAIVSIEGVRPNHREIDRILSVVVMVEGVKDVKSLLKQG